jgi:hypothetical protein
MTIYLKLVHGLDGSGANKGDPARRSALAPKSAVARPEERKFLGFSISNDGSERRIAPKALDKFKEQIRELTSRTRGLSLPQIIEELTPYLIGWRSYFGFCQTPRALTILEAWIRRRLRSYLWRQWRLPGRGADGRSADRTIRRTRSHPCESSE